MPLSGLEDSGIFFLLGFSLLKINAQRAFI